MVEEFKQNEDVLSLARYLGIGIILAIFVAFIFEFIYLLLAPSSTLIDDITKNIWGALYTLAFIIAFFCAIYGLLVQVAQDDSNAIRVISLVYAFALLTTLLALFFFLGFVFTNPSPITIGGL